MGGRFSVRRPAAELAPVDEPAAPEGVAWTVFPESGPDPIAALPAAPMAAAAPPSTSFLSTMSAAAPAPAPSGSGANPLLTEKLLDAKVRLHRRLIEV